MTEEERGRRRAALLLVPLLLLGAAFCFWTLFASATLGEAESFIPAPLGSDALANYGEDEITGRLRSLSISIVEAVIRDRDPEEEDAGARATDVSESLKSPVPTVTPKPGDPTGTPTAPPTPTVTPELTVTGTATLTATPLPSPTRTSTATDVPTADPTSTSVPSPTPSKTPTASKTPTPTWTPSNTPTPTSTWTPAPCKVPPEVEMILPLDGTVYGSGTFIEGRARAYDPDNENPSDCALSSTADGPGIQQVEFEVIWLASPSPPAFTKNEVDPWYCTYDGNGACQTVSVDGGDWPDSTPINDGVYQLRARAKDDENVYSAWVTVGFTINLPAPTPTPTPSLTPSPTVPAPTSTFTPSPTVDICAGITLAGFNKSGSEAWLTLTNGSISTLTIDQIDVSWGFSADLSAIKLQSNTIWSGDEPSPWSVSSGWSGSLGDRQIASGTPKELKFTFESGASTVGYSMYVHFDNTCDVSFNNN